MRVNVNIPGLFVAGSDAHYAAHFEGGRTASRFS